MTPPVFIWTVCAKPARFTVSIPRWATSTDLVYGLLAANRGVAIVPVVMGCHMIATHPNSHVCIRAIEDALPPVIIGVGTLKNQAPTQATDLFLQFLKDTLLQEEQMVRELGYGSLL